MQAITVYGAHDGRLLATTTIGIAATVRIAAAASIVIEDVHGITLLSTHTDGETLKKT
ncbi:MAG: hypothetical protein L0Y80_10685 [Ignavibacteriae bacterium]|nr:hypothetical protein [Ignavibacteriota bacterium]MCI0707935.1 hypothetical protein [Ignavibacteriota bacterium]